MSNLTKTDYIVAVSLFQRFSSSALHSTGIVNNVCKPLAPIIPFLSPAVIGDGWINAFEGNLVGGVRFLFDTGWIEAWPDLAQSKMRDQFIYWASYAKTSKYQDYKYLVNTTLLALAMLDFEKGGNHITVALKGQKRDDKVRRFLTSLHCLNEDVIEGAVTIIANINFLCKKKNLTTLEKLKQRLKGVPVKGFGNVLGILSNFNINKRQYSCVEALIRLEGGNDKWPF